MRPTLTFIVLLTCIAGCADDGVTDPGVPDPPPPLPTTGQIVVSVASNLFLELSLAIEGVGSWQVRSNSEIRVPNVAPGPYRISLTIRANANPDGASCEVHDGSERTASVAAGGTTLVAYELECRSPHVK
jgi:hypothetical protein